MDDKWYCCCGGIIVIFIIFAGASLLGDIHWGSDDYVAEDIYVSDFDSGITQYGDDNDYMYHVYYNLKNVSTSFEDSEVITYFYSGDDIVLSNEVTHLSNNTTQEVTYDDINGLNMIIASAFLHSDNFTNITHVKIVLIKDGEIIFSTTHAFNMKNFEIDDLDDEDDDTNDYGDEDDELGFTDDYSSDDSSNYQSTYVASANSDKFHEPSCSYAQKIKDYNKIYFSSREEAINAGYEPCGVCYP